VTRLDLGTLPKQYSKGWIRKRRTPHQHITISQPPTAHAGQTDSWWLRFGATDQREGFTAVANVYRKPEGRAMYARPID
jgi:hypothetical protein